MQLTVNQSSKDIVGSIPTLGAKLEKIMEDELVSCGCWAYEEHPCPFQEEMNYNSNNYCTCCSTCERKCAEDI